MEVNTKQYMKEIVEDLEIQLNTLSIELSEVFKTKKKLRKFYEKVIKNIK